MILVTGGAGFIGSNFVLQWIAEESDAIVNLDNLTYAGNLENLISLTNNPKHTFIKGDIKDQKLVKDLLNKYQPKAIINFAAESHVDRSIDYPAEFVQTNIVGTFNLLNEAYQYWKALPPEKQNKFRFVHISTDEVFGSLDAAEAASTELSKYAPNSPYSASKASADFLVRSYHKTFNFPTLTTYCTNNYGPYQFPEKLIPLVIINALKGKKLPIYGDGGNIRNWIYVEDHCNAVRLILTKGRPGESYNIANPYSNTNLEVVKEICKILDELFPKSPHFPHASLIQFVKDRPGHDRRYALDTTKIQTELGWKPKAEFESNLRKTVLWYIDNSEWIKKVTTGEYRNWMKTHYPKEIR